jgi:hypothetical protein
MGLVFDIYRSMQPTPLQTNADVLGPSQNARIDAAEDASDRVAVRFDRILILVDAMWELMSERLGLSEADLLARAAEIDARDGTVDGRRTTPPRRCSKCDAAIPHDRETCVFCGHAEPGVKGFDQV